MTTPLKIKSSFDSAEAQYISTVGATGPPGLTGPVGASGWANYQYSEITGAGLTATLSAADVFVVCKHTGVSLVVTLPALPNPATAPTTRQCVTIVNTVAVVVTVGVTGDDTLVGAGCVANVFTSIAQNGSVTIIADGGQGWRVASRFIA